MFAKEETKMLSKAIRIITMLTILAGALAFAPSAFAGSEACDTRVNNTQAKLLECVTLESVREHQIN